MVEPIEPNTKFKLQDYYQHPERYRPVLERRYLPYLTILMNCIYWEPKYPHFVTKRYLRELYSQPTMQPRLRVIGDISCDIQGGIEATIKPTDSGNPVYVYNPFKDCCEPGIECIAGPVILAVDNLPCELPAESSTEFSSKLLPFIPAIAQADFTAQTVEDTNLPPEIQRAVIVYKGKLTPSFRYLEKFIPK